MPTKPLTKEQAKQAVDVFLKCGRNIQKAANALRIARGTLQNRLHVAATVHRLKVPQAAAHDDVLLTAPELPVDKPEIENLRDRVYELESQLKTARKETLDDEYVKRKIIGLSSAAFEQRPPEWTLRRPHDNDSVPGTPMTLWSDWHMGEVVYPAQVGNSNAFDMEIAQHRVRRLVEKTVHLLRDHVVNPSFPGIVVNLGGDMLSGDIHEELRETNELPTMPALLETFGLLKWSLSTMADEFGRVFVPAVPGNHGRNTRKPRAKGRAWTNFDWLLYQFLVRSFEKDDRVTFYVPDGPDAFYRVYRHRYLLTHGDQFRGGDGMIGHFGPVLRGHKKKLSRNANIGLEFDTLLHGHFHTYHPTPRIIGNGSLKGYDEYANMENFGFEPPQQALWLSHPTRGITFHMPVHVEDASTEDQDAAWVSLPAANGGA